MNQKLRLIYDGVCNFCTSAVRFLYALDRGRLVEYVPYQQLDISTRTQYGLTAEALQGRMYLILENGSLAGGAIAIANVCKILSPLSFICNVLKTSLAQTMYDWIARRRYRIFGCRRSCYIVGGKRV